MYNFLPLQYQQIFYNDSHKDVQSGMDYYILTGLKASSVYNISVAAITGVNNDIIGDYVSVILTTPVGGEYKDSNSCILQLMDQLIVIYCMPTDFLVFYIIILYIIIMYIHTLL